MPPQHFVALASRNQTLETAPADRPCQDRPQQDLHAKFPERSCSHTPFLAQVACAAVEAISPSRGVQLLQAPTFSRSRHALLGATPSPTDPRSPPPPVARVRSDGKPQQEMAQGCRPLPPQHGPFQNHLLVLPPAPSSGDTLQNTSMPKRLPFLPSKPFGSPMTSGGKSKGKIHPTTGAPHQKSPPGLVGGFSFPPVFSCSLFRPSFLSLLLGWAFRPRSP